MTDPLQAQCPHCGKLQGVYYDTVPKGYSERYRFGCHKCGNVGPLAFSAKEAYIKWLLVATTVPIPEPPVTYKLPPCPRCGSLDVYQIRDKSYGCNNCFSITLPDTPAPASPLHAAVALLLLDWQLQALTPERLKEHVARLREASK